MNLCCDNNGGLNCHNEFDILFILSDCSLQLLNWCNWLGYISKLSSCSIKWICRLGSARAVNRRYISDCVPLKYRMQASAGFVSASALGMACGPALAGLLQIKFKIYKITFNQETLPGWVMAVLWLLYLVLLWITFREPARDTEVDPIPQEPNTGIISFIVLDSVLPFSLGKQNKCNMTGCRVFYRVWKKPTILLLLTWYHVSRHK